jgi:hypothetical protein
MKYEEPSIQIIMLDNVDIIRTSNVIPGDGIPIEDEENW